MASLALHVIEFTFIRGFDSFRAHHFFKHLPGPRSVLQLFRAVVSPSALLFRALLPFLRLRRHHTRSLWYGCQNAALASAARRPEYQPNPAMTCRCDVDCECLVRRYLLGLPFSDTSARVDRRTTATCQAGQATQTSNL